MPKRKYYKRPDGLYETSRTIDGKRHVFRGRTCKEVDDKIAAYKAQRDMGERFETRADEWIAKRETSLSRSARHVYGYALKRLKEEFKGYASDIKPIDVDRYIERISKRYSAQTVGIDISVMRQVLDHCVLSGDIDINPAASIKQDGRGISPKERHALTVEQETKVKACRSGDWWLFGYMLLYTGARRGELLALNWSDIDHKAGVIHFNKKLSYVNENKPRLENWMKSKNGIRDTPIMPQLAAVLPKSRIGKVFQIDGHYLSGSNIKCAWRDYCLAAGLADEDGKPVVTPHQFRHSFATLCFEAGISIESTAKWMGDTPETIAGVYQELRPDFEKSEIEKLKVAFG